MTPEQVIDIGGLAVKTLLLISAPAMAVALVAGLIIALFQALTSIQEMTLTFVPKIVFVFFALLMFLPWMSDKLMSFTVELFSYISGGGGGIA